MKSIKEIRTKDINDLFSNIVIGIDGEIIYSKEKCVMYQITPLSVTEKDTDFKEKVFNLYYGCIKGMPNNFQILIMRERLDFNDQIIKCKKKLANISSDNLKKALLNYMDKLNKIKEESKNNFKYYLVIPKFESNDTEIINMFSNLAEIGLSLRRINDSVEISSILNSCMKKEVIC